MRKQDRFAAEDRRPYTASFHILVISLIIVAAFSLLAIRLYSIQMLKGGEYASDAERTKTQTIQIEGVRGSIYDSTGLLLAANNESFDIQFSWDPDHRTREGNAAYTKVLNRVIDLVEEGGGTVLDSFSIVKGDNGVYRFVWENVLDEDAAEARTENWFKNMSLDRSAYQEPGEIIPILLTRYGIPEETDEERKFQLLSIWQEMQLNSYSAYIPRTIASDVPRSVVAQLKLESAQLDGISVLQTTTRVYPQHDMAAHIIGYVGRISEENVEHYLNLGYDRNDTIGVSGIEKSMEEYLTGSSAERRGVRTVEVDNRSKVIRELDFEPQTDGNDVILTLDMRLQNMAYDAVAQAIDDISSMEHARVQSRQSEYDKLIAERGGRPINYAQSGAAVIMDVHTGNILACVDVPSYDLNLFVGGISQEDYDKLINDPANPLFSRSISSRATPGSIFKPVTATAALMEGAIDKSTIIVDTGTYTQHGIPDNQAIHCWNRSGHGSQNVVQAIQNSCNVFFYETSYRLGNDRLVQWASTLGLTSRTGIEVPGEAKSQVASPQVFYDPEYSMQEQSSAMALLTAAQIRDYIRDIMDFYSLEYPDEVLNPAIEKIFQSYATDKEHTRERIYRLLVDEVGIPEAIVLGQAMDAGIYQILHEINFSMVDQMYTGIGQSFTLLTPIAVARYISAIVNGGYVYEAHVVDKVVDKDGKIVLDKEPVVVAQTGVTPEITELVMNGMHQAVLNGSSAGRFYGFKYRDQIAGKTGTAEVSDIDIENNSWFMCYAPCDDPQIAVVIYIPNGYSSAYCIEPAKEIVEYYLDNYYYN